VPWRDELTVLLDEDAVLEGVGRANLAGGVCHVGCGVGSVVGAASSWLEGKMASELLDPRIDFLAGLSGGMRHGDERQGRPSAWNGRRRK
jgi:hypothetical protein